MKMLVIADIHGDFNTLEQFIDITRASDFDLIICPGDFTDMFSVPREFSQIDIANLILQKLLALGRPLLCVPGNHDPYEIVELFDNYNINLHARVRKACGIKFLGWGGAPTPFNTIFEPSDEETREMLDSLLAGVGGEPFVLVTHDPPKNTSVDRVTSGDHVGSPVIRKFIEKNQPILALSAHIHESPGQETIGKTTLFYPGALFNGLYGEVEIDGTNVRCSQKKFQKTS